MSWLKHFILITLLLLTSCQCAIGQDVFYQINSNDGLQNNYCESVFCDSRGYVWIGSQGSIQRYSGSSITVFNRTNFSKGLYNPLNTYEIIEDFYGNIWFACEERLLVLRPNSRVFEDVKFKNNPTKHVQGTKALVIKDSTLWLGGYSGLYKISLQKNKIFQAVLMPNVCNQQINKLAVSDSCLYIGTETNYFSIYNFQKNTVRVLYMNSYIKTHTINNVRALLLANDSNLWIGTYNNGLYLYNIKTNKFKNYKYYKDKSVAENETHNMIRCFSKELNNNDSLLLIGTYDNGLANFNTKTGLFSFTHHEPQNSYSIASENVRCIFTDHQNGITWVATEAGISYSINAFNSFKYESLNLNKNSFVSQIVSIIDFDTDYKNNHIIWIGTYGSGLLKYNSVNKSSTYFNTSITKGINGNIIVSISNDSEFVFIGTSQGICRLNKKSNTAITYLLAPEDTNALTYAGTQMMKTSADSLLITCVSKIGLLNIKNSGIRTILKTEKGNCNNMVKQGNAYYITINDGLIHVFNKQLKEVHKINLFSAFLDQSVDEGFITTIIADGNTVLWILIKDGLLKYNTKSQQIIRYKNNSDNASNYFLSGVIVGNYLWTQVNNQICAFNKQTGSFSGFRNRFDNLLINQNTKMFYGTDSLIYMPCHNGFIKFDPKVIYSIKTNKQTLLDEFIASDSTFNISLIPNHNLQLKPYQNNISFTVNVLSYYNSRDNKYRYKLMGIDKSFKQGMPSKPVNYYNLAPGQYALQFYGIDALGNKSKIQQVSFYIATIWYNTWWFKLLAGMGLISIAYSYYRIRINQIKRLATLRNTLASDLHDEVGSTLTSIYYSSEFIKMDESIDENKKTALDNISKSALDSVETIRDIVWTLSPENDTLLNMVARMRDVINTTANSTNSKIHFISNIYDAEQRLTMQVRKNIFLIFREALNNALKYAQAQNIHINLTTINNTLYLTIEDDGIGITSPKFNSGGNGLRNMKKRATELGGTLSIQQNNGTQIILETPFQW